MSLEKERDIMAESIAEFFEDDEIKRSVPANAAMIVQAYLTENTSVSDVAQALLAEFDAPGPDASKLWSLVCYIIVPLAEERPESHEGLVALLGELKGLIQQQQQQRQNDSSISTSSGNLKVKDLSLVYELYEVSLRYGDPDPSDLSMRELLQNEWASLNRFAALVHKENVESLSFWGQNTIEFAIRRGGWRINWKGPGQCTISCILNTQAVYACLDWAPQHPQGQRRTCVHRL